MHNEILLQVLPNARRDLLILLPSRNRSPVCPVAHPLSDPARSMRDIFAILKLLLNPEARSLCLIHT